MLPETAAAMAIMVPAPSPINSFFILFLVGPYILVDYQNFSQPISLTQKV